jgi:hypothetical protein
MTERGAGTSRGESAQVEALQSVLAAENAAIFGYGVAGAYLTGGQRTAATQFWDGHRSAGDTLAAMLRARGAQPAAAGDAYSMPFPVHTAHEAALLATFIEDGITTAYLGLVAAGDAGLREFGARAMQDSAVRSAYWRGSSLAFPGLAASTPNDTHMRRVQ